jgi:NADH-quinone oxidoreductase subunit K
MNLSIYLMFSACMFSGGILGILMNNKNLILLLIYIELILLAVNTNFIIFSKLWNDINGQIFVLFVLTISAAEIAVALAIIFKLFQTSQTINITDLSSLRQ